MEKGTTEDMRMDMKRKVSPNTNDCNSQVGNTGSKMTIPNWVRNLGETTQKQLRCLYTNARSLGNTMEELELLMQEVKPDIIGVMETWWNSSHNWNMGIEGYVLFRKDRNKRKNGGAAWYINDVVECKQVRSDEMDKIESVCVNHFGGER